MLEARPSAMAFDYRVVAILFFYAISLGVNGCAVDDVAVYKVKVFFMWSEESFPKDYPLYRPKAQWSPVFGQSHNSSYKLYHIGEVARTTIREFAQVGKIDKLVEEGDEDAKIYDQFAAPPVGSGVGETENMVFVDGAHSLISLISRIIPSPDWFIGVDSLDLCVDSWIEQITLDLSPLDAGAASGLTFTAPRFETSPPESVNKHGPRKPNHPAAGFYYPQLKELPVIAKVELTKIKEYSTKELNNLARIELLELLKKKNLRKGLAAKRPNSARNYMPEDAPSQYILEMTTKNNIGRLMDLEEDPVGTPRPNLPDNEVIVVTESPFTTTTTEHEFGNKLKNMDEVVLAIANGRRLGLGKHLPRHFRSRLHHAVNRIQPNDCLVSEWSDWSPCSVTCGFGDQFRSRRVIREKQDGGRKCPDLTDRKHCGNINSCAHIDFFEW